MIIHGYASVFHVEDYYEEKTRKETFKNLPPANQISMFFKHDINIKMGKWTNIWVDKRGLYVEGFVFDEFRLEILKLIKDKENGLSIGFFGDEIENQYLVCDKLFEISIVRKPANPLALFKIKEM